MFTTIFVASTIAIAVGYKELPRYSRIFGRFAGRSVKYLGELRATVQEAQGSNSELAKLKRDFDDGMQQLHSIRGEMRQGITLRTLVPNNNNASDTTIAKPTSTTATTSTPTTTIPLQQIQVPNTAPGNFAQDFAQDFAQAFTTTTLQQQQPALFTNAKPVPQQPFALPTSTIALQKSVDAKQHPFSTVQFGYTHHKELLEDESTLLRTERMGSGADFLNIAILEQNFAEMLRDKKI